MRCAPGKPIAVVVLGDGGRVASGKLIEDFAVARRDPSRKLKLGRTPINFQSVFGGQPGFQDIELEWADDTN